MDITKGEIEETRRGVLKSARKRFLPDNIAAEIADQYTVLMKGINFYIRFLRLNSIEKIQTMVTKN